MKALANSLLRIWSAKNRLSHRTRLVRLGSNRTSPTTTFYRMREKFLECVELARQTAPTVIVLTLNIFR